MGIMILSARNNELSVLFGIVEASKRPYEFSDDNAGETHAATFTQLGNLFVSLGAKADEWAKSV
jgi:hypothetical protein